MRRASKRWVCIGALALVTAGCAPKSYEDCKAEAAKAPTEAGVRTGVQACFEKFEAPRLKLELEAEKAKAEEIAKVWDTTVAGARTMESVVSLIGRPEQSVPIPCPPFPDQASPTKCIAHSWKDARYPDACKSPPKPFDATPSFDKKKEDGFCRWHVYATTEGVIVAQALKPGPEHASNLFNMFDDLVPKKK